MHAARTFRGILAVALFHRRHVTAIPSTFRAYAAIALFLAFVPAAPAQYSGGSGTAQDPYQIATAADLIALGETPEDYDKHFLLTADIDLDPNLPGRKVFDRAVIAPDINDTVADFQGTAFTGVFDGNGRTISHLTITGKDYLGLFGQLGSWDICSAEVENLELVDVKITGTGTYVGGLVGQNHGSIGDCYSSGPVSGEADIGGLVGYNGGRINTSSSGSQISGGSCAGGLVGRNWGSVAASYSTGSVSGEWSVGGLVGQSGGSITTSYGSGTVTGDEDIGGLVGCNSGGIAASYSTGTVTGDEDIGGLVGYNGGRINTSSSTGSVSGKLNVGGLVGSNCWESSIANSYSKGTVTGSDNVGGLAGLNWGADSMFGPGEITASYSRGSVNGTGCVGGLVGCNIRSPYGWGWITKSFWDIQTSTTLDGVGHVYPDANEVVGKTTAEMQTAGTFLEAGWDFVGETANGTEDIWWIDEGQDYPRLWWELYIDD